MLPSSTQKESSRLFDFQVNGFAGVDFQDEAITPAALRSACLALQRHGVVAIFLTLITDSVDRLCAQLDRLADFRAADPLLAGTIAGFHLEGPWLSAKPGFVGAHNGACMIPPRWDDFQRLQQASRRQIRLVTLAPELPGSPAFIAALAGSGVHVSLGHTDASHEQIDDAIRAGARFCTHLGNGAPLLLPRHDNVIQRLLARDELTACFIPDGLHLPPFVLKNFFRAKPAGCVLFTTDAMAGAGAPPGGYTLGGRLRVELGADLVAREPNGQFAGSTLTPEQGVQCLRQYLGLSLTQANNLWSGAPALALGVNLPPSPPAC